MAEGRTTPRQRAHARTMVELKRLALAQLAVEGSSGLSLRALARDLGLVSSAVYRYVPSRDELLTLLIVDAYDALGEAAEVADRRRRRADLRGRWFAIGRALRRWALAHPAEWGLLYGSPVPGYVAPAERTTGPGGRVPLLLLRLLVEVEAAAPRLPAGPPVTAAQRADLEQIRRLAAGPVSDDRLAAGLLAWTSIFGIVSFELFGQYHNAVDHGGPFLD
ncbi:MAG: TetR/AcrR family transcriptional regulator, partial [Candidatus Dormibacteraceae bacterium]